MTKEDSRHRDMFCQMQEELQRASDALSQVIGRLSSRECPLTKISIEPKQPADKYDNRKS